MSKKPIIGHAYLENYGTHHKASALQRWLEIMARAGSRYREQIHAIFGERIPD